MRLAYCTNVHPAEEVALLERELEAHAPAPSGDERVGLGLWLPDRLARTLDGDAALRGDFAAFLSRRGLAVETVNAFPFGGFHRPRVKERVFLPHWGEAPRLEQTLAAARVLAALLPEGAKSAVSTLPVGAPAAGFRPRHEEAAVRHLLRAAEALARLEERTGRRIVLALEPEPLAWLSTAREAAAFLDERVFAGRDDARRRHLGLCVDACHEAVAFEAPSAAWEEARRRGVVVGKVQVTCALEVRGADVDDTLLSRLRRFDEGRYFHQAFLRMRSGRLVRFLELAPALAALAGDAGEAVGEARFHFHVPVHSDPVAPLATTRAHLEESLAAAFAAGVDLFELETYTFSVLPGGEGLDRGGLSAAIASEIEWTRRFLRRAAAGLGPRPPRADS